MQANDRGPAGRIPIQVNEELFAANQFFSAKPERLDEAKRLFQFDQRRVLLGPGSLDRLGEECQRLRAGRVLLVRDLGIAAFETPVREALASRHIELGGVYDGVISNPTIASVEECAGVIRQANPDAVIALGGGSTIDTCKTALCVAAFGQSIAGFFGRDLVPEPPKWPLIAIPTTAGTGSEASSVAVIADETGKQVVFSPHILPKAALVDPRLTKDLPPVLTAITGIDALSHALEGTASKRTNAIGDAVARESLQAGCPYLERAINHGADDPQARYNMARCSLLAGLLLGPIGTGPAHALGYPIEKFSDMTGNAVPHGAAVALMLPGVMRHNMPAAADKYYYSAGVAGLDLKGKTREEGVEALAAWIDRIRREHTPWGSLESSGLGDEAIPQMVEIAFNIRRLLDPNPVEMTGQDIEQIYRGVLS